MLQFIASIGSLIPGLFGYKLSYKAAKIAGFVLLGLLLVAVLSLGKCAYDASVINQHEAKDRAEKAERQLNADRAADEATANKAAEATQLQQELDEATKKAAAADPAGAQGNVGPVTDSYYDTLRKKEKR